MVTPFEKNLEIWRQLWRVIERSDLVSVKLSLAIHVSMHSRLNVTCVYEGGNSGGCSESAVL